MAGWHHWLDGHESEWTPGIGDGEGGLACCDSWGRKESDTTERLDWTELNSKSLPGRLQSMGSLRVGHDWATSLSLFTFMHWRRNGNPLQCSCLENPRDRGACWAAVYGVAQSRTWLPRLSSNSRSREGEGTPLQYSCLENPMGGGAWWAAVHGVAKSWTRLSDLAATGRAIRQ